MTVLRDIRDAADWPIEALLGELETVPAQFSLAAYRPPIGNQGSESDCTAWGLRNATRSYIREHRPDFDFEMSANFNYWNARSLEGTTAMDAGVSSRSAIKAATKWGMAHDELFPSTFDTLFQKPPQEAYDDAIQYKVQAYYRIPAGHTHWMKQAISNRYRLIVALKLYSGWANVGSDGVIPDPMPGEVSLDAHQMMVDEYAPGRFTAVNQYGEWWGDKGVGYFSEAYLSNPENILDVWCLKMFGSDAEVAAGRA